MSSSRDLENLSLLNSSPQPELNWLLSPIHQASQAQFNGNLYLQWSHTAPWGLTFRHGRLVWAWAGNHRLRRWRRLVGSHNIQGNSAVQARAQSPQQGFNSTTPVWEYATLKGMVSQNEISRETALAIARENLIEVMFELVQRLYAMGEAPQLESKAFKLDQPLKFFAPSEISLAVGNRWNAWRNAELSNYSPMLAPYLYQPEQLKTLVSATSYRNLEQCLQGQRSLRELAALMNQNLLSLSQTLVSYERRCLIKFAQLPQPLGETLLGQDASTNNAGQTPPLVLCIDDNEMVCRQLGRIVSSSGCRYDAVQDSLSGLQRVLETKPSLIFLDLVMPIVSGYELCSQIRRVQELRDIPIVILTSSDSIIDRVRLKVAGSTIFLPKPIRSTAIQKVLNTYCLGNAAAA